MYIAFGNRVLDSKDFKEIIEMNSQFKVIKDMSKGSKREDIIAFNLKIDVDILKEMLVQRFNQIDFKQVRDDAQKFVMKNCVLHSNYGYSGNIRGELGDSSEFEVIAINNTCYSDEMGLNSFEYTVGQSRLNSMSHGNTSSVLNAGN